jgi:3-methyladenine DNA glycosylase AlkD
MASVRERAGVPLRAGSASAEDVESRLVRTGDPDLASFQQRFFKTGSGEYGEGDVFLGIKVPVLRRIAREYRSLPLQECERLLDSPYHEVRLVALVILVEVYRRTDELTRQSIHDLYLSRTDRVNGWDLVDTSAAWLVGQHLFDKNRSILIRLARSPSLWERRIAIIATHYFIRKGDFSDTFRISDLLMRDRHDLIHKAVGWMLREVGKRDLDAEREFLRDRYRRMPRTMLRYAIEKFPEDERKRYLRGEL